MKFHLKLSDLGFICLGFFSTSQILAFVIGGRIISFYTISIVFVILYLLFNSKNLNVKTDVILRKRFLGWMFISIISGLFGLVYFINDSVFLNRIIGYFPKILLYLFLFLLLSKDGLISHHSRLIIKGIMYGVLANVIWSILDAFTFYSLGYSLTNQFFQSYIQAKEIRYGMLSLITGAFIRSGGLNADPANLGMFATILASYSMLKKQYWMLLLAVLSSLASISFIAIVGILLVLIYHLFKDISNGRVKWTQILTLIIVLFLGVYFLSSDNSIIQGALSGLNERVTMKEDAGTDDNRTQYWVNFIPAIFYSPIYWLIGTGYMTASYPYLVNNLVSHVYDAYDPENTYFSAFFNFGFFGFVLFVSFYYRIWAVTKKYLMSNSCEHNISLLAISEGVIIAFAGYHFTLYSVVLLFSICAIFNNNSIK